MVPGGDLVVFFCRCLCKDALFNSSVGGCITLYFFSPTSTLRPCLPGG